MIDCYMVLFYYEIHNKNQTIIFQYQPFSSPSSFYKYLMNKKKTASELKKKLKRQDFMFEDGWFDEVNRKPGELHMQQFQISDCQECKIGLFDSSACVYVDQCKYCWIFIGPCQSSIFVRDCIGLTIIAACRQFRVRDSSNCKIALYCQSQPIIESSHHLQFDCFPDWGYKQMPSHFQQCNMSPWNNHWYDIYDFTPRTQNFQLKKLTNQELDSQKFMETITKNSLTAQTKIVPRCLGKVDTENDNISIVIFNEIPKVTVSPSFLESRIAMIPDSLASLNKRIPQRKMILFLKIFRMAKSQWKSVTSVVQIVEDLRTIQTLQSQVFVPFRDEH